MPILNDNTLIEMMLSDFAAQFQTCIPAIVKKVISRDTVEVSPAVLPSDEKDKPIGWANITTTVLTPFGGGMFISMPLSVGDTGWLVGADMDTSKFKEEKKPSQQNIWTRHLYQYGFFVPDAINGYTISDEDNGSMVIASLDGNTKIVIDKDQLKINAKSITIASEGNNITIDGVNFKNHTHEAGALMAPNGAVTGKTGGVG